jgi:hypothetical protein
MTFDREQDYGFDGYATSVVEAADDFGFLTPADARKLVADHGADWSDWVASRPMGAVLCEARPLLHWLGY